MDAEPLLRVTGLWAGYGELDILQGVSLEVRPGEVVCVLGPNGAGKSTVFRTIYGFVRARRGEIWFDSKETTNRSPQQMLAAGITIVPQLRSVFPEMTVEENLDLGLVLERDRERIRKRIEVVLEMFPVLEQRRKQLAGTLSGGEQRMLEIGRALLPEPKMLLLDEPSAGLAPRVVREVFGTLRRLNEELGLSVLMIEQNARQGLEASHRGYVLELGRNRFEGLASDLLGDPQVRRAFLGLRDA